MDRWKGLFPEPLVLYALQSGLAAYLVPVSDLGTAARFRRSKALTDAAPENRGLGPKDAECSQGLPRCFPERLSRGWRASVRKLGPSIETEDLPVRRELSRAGTFAASRHVWRC